MDYVKAIKRLQAQKNAVILAHNYQPPEVQELADFVGDSLGLSQAAARTQAAVIVFCGVHFMAETAKLLSPQKTVLIPELKAGCPMADMVRPEDVQELRERHPQAKVVCYVNTTAAVKALCDVCCTSANAVGVVAKMFEQAPQVIFLPDKHLGAFVAKKLGKTHAELVCYPGFCPTHARITPDDIRGEQEKHPAAEIIAHPECAEETLALATTIASTEGICRRVRESTAGEFIIATEIGIIPRLRRENPGKRFYRLPAAVCPNMKMITPASIYQALAEGKHEIDVPEAVATRARQSILAMLTT